MKRSHLSLALTLLAACGGSASRNALTGEITSSSTAIHGDLRAAVVWVTLDFSGHTNPADLVTVAGDVSVSRQLPTRFALDRDSLAPALHTPAGQALVALGTLVAYEDSNGNGQLDFDLSGAEPLVLDRIVGQPDTMLVYGENRTGQSLPDFPEGLHLYAMPDAHTPPPACADTSPFGARELPLDTVLSFSLHDGAFLPSAMCPQPNDVTDCTPAAGETALCNAEGSGYVVEKIANRGTPCERRVTCVSRQCPAGEPLPVCAGK